jgi:IS5 family transposase
MVLLPQGLHALKQVAKEVGLDLRGAYLNLDGGFDSAHNRKCIFNAGMIPNIPENPRNRKHTKRGRKRLFNAAIHALRMRVERTFAWEDKFKRLLIRFERIQQRHYGMKLMAYTSPFAIEKVPILNLPKVLCGPEGEGYTLRRLVVILCDEGNTHRG